MELLMPFQNDESSVHDMYYAKLKSGKYMIKFNLEDRARTISAREFDARKKGAAEQTKAEASLNFTL